VQADLQSSFQIIQNAHGVADMLVDCGQETGRGSEQVGKPVLAAQNWWRAEGFFGLAANAIFKIRMNHRVAHLMLLHRLPFRPVRAGTKKE